MLFKNVSRMNQAYWMYCKMSLKVKPNTVPKQGGVHIINIRVSSHEVCHPIIKIALHVNKTFSVRILFCMSVPKHVVHPFLTILYKSSRSLTLQWTQSQRALHHLVLAAPECGPRLLTANQSLHTFHISQPPCKHVNSAACMWQMRGS